MRAAGYLLWCVTYLSSHHGMRLARPRLSVRHERAVVTVQHVRYERPCTTKRTAMTNRDTERNVQARSDIHAVYMCRRSRRQKSYYWYFNYDDYCDYYDCCDYYSYYDIPLYLPAHGLVDGLLCGVRHEDTIEAEGLGLEDLGILDLFSPPPGRAAGAAAPPPPPPAAVGAAAPAPVPPAANTPSTA